MPYLNIANLPDGERAALKQTKDELLRAIQRTLAGTGINFLLIVAKGDANSGLVDCGGTLSPSLSVHLMRVVADELEEGLRNNSLRPVAGERGN